ncbi:MAG: hypothetical protein CSB13_00405 [Chloroflexi bacterium]|nr:MAG: hypothetical protein CSB13_00405 [Chloroflexota bacterium]
MSQQVNPTESQKKWYPSAVFLCLVGALLAALLLALPLLREPGLLNTRGGGDSPFLLQRLHQLETALRDGHFPVRWMPDANYGYGYPFYNFYAPLSIYITAVFRFLGFSYVRALQFSQLAGFGVAAGSMYALGRRWFGTLWAGLLASVAYSTAPFHMVNVYVRGDSLAEFWAMAFYPLVLLAADYLLENSGEHGRRRSVALFGMAYGALVLSHNISALIFSPFLLLYLLLRWLWLAVERRQSGHNSSCGQAQGQSFALHSSFLLLKVMGGVALALALSAWFFVPALVEQSGAQLGPVTEGYFHYSHHFRGMDLVQTSLMFDYDVAGGNAFRMGLGQAITAVSGLLVLLFWRKGGPGSLSVKWFLLPGFLIATFMITPLSRLLWAQLPLLSFAQFPWRFLSVQAFVGALAAAGLALLPGRKWLVPALSVVLLFTALGDLHTDHLVLTDADVTARKLAEYEWYTGNIGSTVSAEYLPHTVQPRPMTSRWLHDGRRDHVGVVTGAATVALVERRAIHQSWFVQAHEAATLVFPTMAWPGWGVTVDGEQVEFQPAAGSGLIQVAVPAGEHVVALHLSRTPVRLLAEWVSLTAVIVLIFLLFSRPRHLPERKWGAAFVALLFVFLIVSLWPTGRRTDDDLNWDFAQMAYLHHENGSIPFTDHLYLDAYQYSDHTLKSGETLTIEGEWSGSGLSGAPVATIALYSPAITRPPILAQVTPPALAVDSQALAEKLSFSLTLPDDIPPGLYVPRLVVAGHQAVTPAGLTRGSLFLRPVQIVNHTVALADPHGDLDVAVITAAVRDAEPTLDLHLAWFTARPLTHNYNVSLRLLDATGHWLRQLDTQPGFGFLPSSVWSVGEWVPDWLAIRLPELDSTQRYPLLVQLYDVAEPGAPVLTRRLGWLQTRDDAWVFQPSVPNYDLPEGVERETAVFGERIQLLGSKLTQDDTTVKITLYWQALAPIQADYTRFVHLLGSETGHSPPAQDDSYPVYNSYPTSQWTTGEIVTDDVILNIGDVSAGEYQLIVGFYDEALVRLTAVAADGSSLPHNVMHVGKIKIED